MLYEKVLTDGYDGFENVTVCGGNKVSLTVDADLLKLTVNAPGDRHDDGGGEGVSSPGKQGRDRHRLRLGVSGGCPHGRRQLCERCDPRWLHACKRRFGDGGGREENHFEHGLGFSIERHP